MKEMSKAKIIDKRSEKGIKGERDLLSKLHHPFIVNMHYSFQDKDKLYLVMDLLTGGDLRYHICKRHRFSEKQSRFFIACLLLALEYCHTNHIIHRDIKPENLVLDSKGYLHLTDFGIAKTQQPNNYRETSGTPGYMSPEVMCAQNHTIVVDYFAIGVMGYEFMKGVRPYYGKSRKEIKDKIIAKQVSKGVRILLIVLINYYKESLLIDYVFMKQEKSKNIIGLKIFRGKIYIILN
jgi:serine/threonine protein kinase